MLLQKVRFPYFRPIKVSGVTWESAASKWVKNISIDPSGIHQTNHNTPSIFEGQSPHTTYLGTRQATPRIQATEEWKWQLLVCCWLFFFLHLGKMSPLSLYLSTPLVVISVQALFLAQILIHWELVCHCSTIQFFVYSCKYNHVPLNKDKPEKKNQSEMKTAGTEMKNALHGISQQF